MARKTSKKRTWMLLLGTGRPSLFRIEAGNATAVPLATKDDRPLVGPSTLPDMAEQVVETLTKEGYAGEPVLLALDSPLLVSQSVEVPTHRVGRNHQAMAYLMEPSLPWAAEEAAIDYDLHRSTAFMVATPLQPLKDWIASLERQGIRIDSIAPLASLTVASLQRQSKKEPAPLGVLAAGPQGIDYWTLEQGHPTCWNWIPGRDEAIQAASIIRTLRQSMLTANPPQKLLTLGLPTELHAEIEQALGDLLPTVTVAPREEESSEEPTEGLSQNLLRALLEGAAILTGQRAAAIEFRQQQLTPKDRHLAIRPQLIAFLLAASLFLAATATSLYLQSNKYNNIRQASNAQKKELFHQLFPQRRVPVGIVTRLEQELTHLRGVRGGADDVPQTVEALLILKKLLEALPEDFRFRLQEMRILNGTLHLVGYVREFRDADRIAEALRSQQLTVNVPATHRQANEIEFRMNVTLPEKKTQKKP